MRTSRHLGSDRRTISRQSGVRTNHIPRVIIPRESLCTLLHHHHLQAQSPTRIFTWPPDQQPPEITRASCSPQLWTEPILLYCVPVVSEGRRPDYPVSSYLPSHCPRPLPQYRTPFSEQSACCLCVVTAQLCRLQAKPSIGRNEAAVQIL